MAFNDPLVRLGDYVEACLGKMLDAQKNRGAFQPYLGNSNVRWGAFDLQNLAVMRFELQEEERYGLREGDLVVCEGGEPGRCAIWQGEVPNMKIQKALHRIRVKDGLDNYFLYYWLLHAGKTGALEPYFTGTTIKHLTGKALAELKIPLPPIDRQRGLAKVLRSLDDKIDLNRRINQTLEAMAQAIFKSWFVDFDPVKAKIAAIEQGEDPLRAAMRAISGKTDAELDQMPREHHDQLAATAALFPDAMEESELGEIPRGWEDTTLGKLCETFGGTIQTGPFGSQLHARDYKNQGIPVVMPQDLLGRRVQTEKIAHIDLIDAERLAKHRIRSGDIVFSRRGDVGRYALVTSREQGWLCGTGCLLVRPSTEASISSYVSCALARPETLEWLVRHAVGATMPNLNTGILSDLPILMPPADAIAAFEQKAVTLTSSVNACNAQSVVLSEIRDTLLPKLLSGDLSVANTKEQVV